MGLPECSADSNVQRGESESSIDANSTDLSHVIPGQELLAQYAEATKSLSAIRELQLESMRAVAETVKTR